MERELQVRLDKAIFEYVILAGSGFHRSKHLATRAAAITQHSSGGSLRLADYFNNIELLLLYFDVSVIVADLQVC